ncbi:TnpA family transposase [Streptomyces avidinii]|uniref:TnpA family transposase n=1 Tax=Streptomyces avidinii TaxID=1895 RepID=A0ABS4L6W1_STRAV|nr:TnpA family transposase [Streptomyces avidinii]
MLWTTRYIGAAVTQLQAEGHEIREQRQHEPPSSAPAILQ